MARFALRVDVRTEVQTQKSASRAKGKLHLSWQQVKVSPLEDFWIVLALGLDLNIGVPRTSVLFAGSLTVVLFLSQRFPTCHALVQTACIALFPFSRAIYLFPWTCKNLVICQESRCLMGSHSMSRCSLLCSFDFFVSHTFVSASIPTIWLVCGIYWQPLLQQSSAFV